MGLNASSDHVPLLGRLGLSDLKSSLNNVVSKGMLQEADERILIGRLREQRTVGVRLELGQLTRHHLHGSSISDLKALLHNVRAELLSRQEVQVSKQVRSKRFTDRLHAQVQHVLNNVVTELILHEAQRIVLDLTNKLHLLLIRRVINAALHHAASMAVGGNLDTVMSNSIVDELVVIGLKTMDALLDDVISIQILDESNNRTLQGLTNQTNLLRRTQLLDGLLNRTSTMHVLRDLHQRATDAANNSQALRRRALFDQLLAEVVSEGIRHEFHDLRHNFSKDQVASNGSLVLIEFLLQITATILILAHLEDLTNALLQGGVGVAHGGKSGITIGGSSRRGTRARGRAHDVRRDNSAARATEEISLGQRRHVLRTRQAAAMGELLTRRSHGEGMMRHVRATIHRPEERSLADAGGMYHRGRDLLVMS